MARPDKVAAVNEVRGRLESANAAVLTDYRGLTVAELAQLRAELRKTDATYAVVKNTLTRLAVREAGLDVPDEMLTGPTAVTFCASDPVGVAKVLRTFSRDHPALVLKGSILDGKLLDAGETMKLADLASREELLAQLAGMMQSIVAKPARLAQANLSKLARLFVALQGRKPADDAAEPKAEEPSAEQASAEELPAEGALEEGPAADKNPKS